jgi:hypothetical protein
MEVTNWIQNNREGSGHGLFKVTVPEFALWKLEETSGSWHRVKILTEKQSRTDKIRSFIELESSLQCLLESVLSLLNSVQTLTPYFSKYRFNIILSYTPIYSSVRDFVHISLLSHACYIPIHLILHDLITQITFGEAYKLWSSTFRKSSPSSRNFHLLESKFLFSTKKSVYPKVSGLAIWSENCKWYSSLPLGAAVSLFYESV